MTKQAIKLTPKQQEQVEKYTKVMKSRSDMTPAQKEAAIEKYTARISTPVTATQH